MTDPKGLVALIEKYIERNADEHGKQWRTDGFNALSYSSYYNGANSMKDHLLKLVEALELLTTDKMGSEVSRSIANVVLHDLKQELGE